MINWFQWFKPAREHFHSWENYENYMKLMKCEECGEDLQDGDLIGLVPYEKYLTTSPDSPRTVKARIVHKKCYDSKIMGLGALNMELSKQFYKRTTKGFKIVLITVEGSSESVILEVHDIIHKALKGEDWAWDAYNA